MKTKLLIYGVGGLGQEIASLVRSLPEWELEGFLDDSVEKGMVVGGSVVLGGMIDLNNRKDKINVVLAVGSPSAKNKILKRITHPDVHYPVLIHPAAILQDKTTIEIGEGTVITAGTILTTDIKVGKHVLLNLRCTIGHHTTIGNFVSVMPGANISGNVKIGNEVLIGSGVNIINNISLGDQCVVGMGATVIREVPPAVTVIGIPAKIKS
jgi:sugar O-acyltransferase (sialic acid O-acetyltransferase NeuD family)